MADLSLKYLLFGEDKTASKTLKGVGKEAESAGSNISGSLKKMAGAVAGVFAAAKVKDFLADSIAEARESQKVGALTEQVIKSTGGAAKVTADQVGDLATAISNKTGIDDEAIQSGANMILTFKNIRNEVGKGNDIFNQATGLVTDMSVAFKTDAKSSALQLGKALNDPIKGISALSRVGVTFTTQQQKQIKTLVDSGKTLDAQKIIIKELQSEFGGAAEASATAGEKFSTTWGNFKEAIGTALLPIIDAVLSKGSKLVGMLTGKIGPAAATVQAGVSALTKAFQDGNVTSDGFIGVMQRIGVQLRNVYKWVQKSLIPALKTMATWIGKHVVPVLISMGKWLSEHATLVQSVAVAVGTMVAAFKIWTAITKTATAVQAVFNTVLSLNPIGLIIIALIGLAAGLVYAYKKSETFRDIVQSAFRGVQAAFHWVIDAAKAVWDWIKSNWPLLLAILLGPFGLAVGMIIKHWDAIRDAGKSVFDWVKTNWPLLLAIITGPIGLAVLAIAKHWDSIKEGATGAKNWIVTKFNELVTFITGLPGKVATAASGMWDGIKDAFKSALNWVIDRWNGLQFTVPGFSAFGHSIGGFTLGVPDIPRFAAGGIVPATPGGRIVRVAEAGQDEAIVPLGNNGKNGFGPMQINVVLDGKVAASALFDPLEEIRRRNAAFR